MCSRERILATVRHQPVDHLPLCFDGIGHQGVEFLSRRYPDQFELARFYLDLGLDTGVRTAPPYHSRKGFETKQWTEHPADAECPLIFKEYATLDLSPCSRITMSLQDVRGSTASNGKRTLMRWSASFGRQLPRSSASTVSR